MFYLDLNKKKFLSCIVYIIISIALYYEVYRVIIIKIPYLESLLINRYWRNLETISNGRRGKESYNKKIVQFSIDR